MPVSLLRPQRCLLQKRCRLHYWGDIDTHGFAILDALRARFDHVESFLMDRGTLMAFESLWGTEGSPIHRDLPRLTSEERTLYDDLRDHRIGRSFRLEQERIGFVWVASALGVEMHVRSCWAMSFARTSRG